MSTPSIATQTIHNTQYGHSHYQHVSTTTYPPQKHNSLVTSAAPSPTYPPQHYNTSSYSTYSRTSNSTPKQPLAQSTSTIGQNTKDSALKMPPNQKRPPNWVEFYKNGTPKEIIVIDDDDDNSPPPTNGTGKIMAPYPATNGQSSKRRKTDATNGARVHTSGHNTPGYGDSATISLDRTTSINTTAPTSLGSHGSVNSTGYAEAQASAGQKRKRVTRQTAGIEKKRQDTRQERNPYAAYVPLQRPPVKAGDVSVRIVKDNTSRGRKVDDEEGHYLIDEGTAIGDRYHIVKLLGQGTFGKVVQAWDRLKKRHVAVKIIRSVQKYRDASKIELRVLETLAQNDSENRNKCIHLRDCFDFRNHICIVTDLLGQSVFDFLKSNMFVPFPSSHIQSFARQLFTSVAFLHDLNLIHTDLKPENILLVSNSYQTFTYNKAIPVSSTAVQRVAKQRRVLLDTDIRLIDFGSATFDDEYHSTVVSTRHYRAPEIILQLGWSYSCDIWSIGCILVEFFTGDALFQTHDNLEHLAMMEVVCGKKIDTKIVRSVTQNRGGSHNNSAHKYFKQTRLAYPTEETSKASRSYVKAMKKLEDIIHIGNPFNKLFLDLLKKIFVYDPNARITAKEALEHPWFLASLTDDGTEATRIRRERAAAQATANERSDMNGR